MQYMELFGISFTNILVWAIFGFSVGYYAHTHDHRYVPGGILVTAIFGCLGAIFGGYLASFILGKTMLQFSIEGLLVAIIGALILAAFYRVSFTKSKDYIHTSKEQLTTDN